MRVTWYVCVLLVSGLFCVHGLQARRNQHSEPSKYRTIMLKPRMISNDFFDSLKGLNLGQTLNRLNHGNQRKVLLFDFSLSSNFRKSSRNSKVRGGTSAGAPVPQEMVNDMMRIRNVECNPSDTIISVTLNSSFEFLQPHCIIAKRCGGCCRGNNQACLPVTFSTKTFQFIHLRMKTNFPNTLDYYTYTTRDIVMHDSCKCKCTQQESDCNPDIQIYFKDYCQCVCNVKTKRCSRRQTFNEKTCKCECPFTAEMMSCSRRQYFNEETCRCRYNRGISRILYGELRRPTRGPRPRELGILYN